jgi:hypothetical protein
MAQQHHAVLMLHNASHTAVDDPLFVHSTSVVGTDVSSCGGMDHEVWVIMYRCLTKQLTLAVADCPSP